MAGMNGKEKKPPMPARKSKSLSGITDEWDQWMKERSHAIAKAALRKGYPHHFAKSKDR